MRVSFVAADSARAPAADAGERTEVLGAEGLIAALQARAQAAVDAGSAVRTLAVQRPFFLAPAMTAIALCAPAAALVPSARILTAS